LPEFAAEWLRQVRASERLLIRAIMAPSRELATMAWAVHPNVASMQHAERLASLYFAND
jgi:alpha-galactosidase/6-phospho-beta-glucosidase family protein